MAQPVRLKATVHRIVEHAPGVRSFYIHPERRVPRFKPGQFMHLALDPYDPSTHWPESRCFSVASPPESRKELRIIVSAVGGFTRRMMELQVDDEVWIKVPYGDFVIDTSNIRRIVLVAGGTGISPFMSFLESKQVLEIPVRVLYGARTPGLLIEASTLDRTTETWPDMHWRAFVESGQYAGAAVGLLSAQAALEAAGNDRETVRFYLSGPPLMLDSLREGLLAAGVVPDCVLQDAWQ